MAKHDQRTTRLVHGISRAIADYWAEPELSLLLLTGQSLVCIEVRMPFWKYK